MANESSKWTEAEDVLLMQFYSTHTRAEIASLLGRSVASIRGRCSRLGLNTKHPAVTESEFDIIRRWYEDRRDVPFDKFDLDGLARKIGRTKQFTSRLARRIGLTQQGRPASGQLKELVGEATAERIHKNGHPRGMLGKKHSDEFKRQKSKQSKEWSSKVTDEDRQRMTAKRNKTMLERYGTGNPSMKGSNGYSRTKSGKRADLNNRFFRSSWEANYARYLNWLVAQGKIERWEYEPQTFVFHGVTRGVLTYTPDFKITELDGSCVWHEVKGWMDAKSKAKLKRMGKFYPNEKVLVIGPQEYKAVSQWAAVIPNWEYEKGRAA